MYIKANCSNSHKTLTIIQKVFPLPPEDRVETVAVSDKLSQRVEDDQTHSHTLESSIGKKF